MLPPETAEKIRPVTTASTKPYPSVTYTPVSIQRQTPNLNLITYDSSTYHTDSRRPPTHATSSSAESLDRRSFWYEANSRESCHDKCSNPTHWSKCCNIARGHRSNNCTKETAPGSGECYRSCFTNSRTYTMASTQPNPNATGPSTPIVRMFAWNFQVRFGFLC